MSKTGRYRLAAFAFLTLLALVQLGSSQPPRNATKSKQSTVKATVGLTKSPDLAK